MMFTSTTLAQDVKATLVTEDDEKDLAILLKMRSVLSNIQTQQSVNADQLCALADYADQIAYRDTVSCCVRNKYGSVDRSNSCELQKGGIPFMQLEWMRHINRAQIENLTSGDNVQLIKDLDFIRSQIDNVCRWLSAAVIPLDMGWVKDKQGERSLILWIEYHYLHRLIAEVKLLLDEQMLGVYDFTSRNHRYHFGTILTNVGELCNELGFMSCSSGDSDFKYFKTIRNNLVHDHQAMHVVTEEMQKNLYALLSMLRGGLWNKINAISGKLSNLSSDMSPVDDITHYHTAITNFIKDTNHHLVKWLDEKYVMPMSNCLNRAWAEKENVQIPHVLPEDRGHFTASMLLSGELRNAIQHQASSELLDVVNAISDDLWLSQNPSAVISEQTQENMRNLVTILSATFNSQLQEVNELLHVQYWIMTIHKEKSNGAFTVANYLLDQVTNNTFIDGETQVKEIAGAIEFHRNKLKETINAFAVQIPKITKDFGLIGYVLKNKPKGIVDPENIAFYQLYKLCACVCTKEDSDPQNLQQAKAKLAEKRKKSPSILVMLINHLIKSRHLPTRISEFRINPRDTLFHKLNEYHAAITQDVKSPKGLLNLALVEIGYQQSIAHCELLDTEQKCKIMMFSEAKIAEFFKQIQDMSKEKWDSLSLQEQNIRYWIGCAPIFFNEQGETIAFRNKGIAHQIFDFDAPKMHKLINDTSRHIQSCIDAIMYMMAFKSLEAYEQSLSGLVDSIQEMIKHHKQLGLHYELLEEIGTVRDMLKRKRNSQISQSEEKVLNRAEAVTLREQLELRLLALTNLTVSDEEQSELIDMARRLKDLVDNIQFEDHLEGILHKSLLWLFVAEACLKFQNYDTVIEVLDTFIDQTSNTLSGEVLTDTAVRDHLRNLETARCIAEQCKGDDERYMLIRQSIKRALQDLNEKCRSQLGDLNTPLQCDCEGAVFARLDDDLIDCSSMIEGKQIVDLSKQLKKIDELLSSKKGYILGKSADRYFEKVRDYSICVIRLIEMSYEQTSEFYAGHDKKECRVSDDIAVQLLSTLSDRQLLQYILLLDSEAQESGLIVENKDLSDMISMVGGLIEAVVRSDNRDDLIGKNWQWIKDKVLSPLLNHMRSRIGYKQLSLLYFCLALCSEKEIGAEFATINNLHQSIAYIGLYFKTIRSHIENIAIQFTRLEFTACSFESGEAVETMIQKSEILKGILLYSDHSTHFTDEEQTYYIQFYKERISREERKADQEQRFEQLFYKRIIEESIEKIRIIYQAQYGDAHSMVKTFNSLKDMEISGLKSRSRTLFKRLEKMTTLCFCIALCIEKEHGKESDLISYLNRAKAYAKEYLKQVRRLINDLGMTFFERRWFRTIHSGEIKEMPKQEFEILKNLVLYSKKIPSLSEDEQTNYIQSYKKCLRDAEEKFNRKQEFQELFYAHVIKVSEEKIEIYQQRTHHVNGAVDISRTSMMPLDGKGAEPVERTEKCGSETIGGDLGFRDENVQNMQSYMSPKNTTSQSPTRSGLQRTTGVTSASALAKKIYDRFRDHLVEANCVANESPTFVQASSLLTCQQSLVDDVGQSDKELQQPQSDVKADQASLGT